MPSENTKVNLETKPLVRHSSVYRKIYDSCCIERERMNSSLGRKPISLGAFELLVEILCDVLRSDSRTFLYNASDLFYKFILSILS